MRRPSAGGRKREEKRPLTSDDLPHMIGLLSTGSEKQPAAHWPCCEEEEGGDDSNNIGPMHHYHHQQDNYQDKSDTISLLSSHGTPAGDLLRKLFFWQLFSMDGAVTATAPHESGPRPIKDRLMQATVLTTQSEDAARGCAQHLLAHVAGCAVEMLTVLFCIALLRHFIKFSVFGESEDVEDRQNNNSRSHHDRAVKEPRHSSCSPCSISTSSSLSDYSSDDDDYSYSARDDSFDELSVTSSQDTKSRIKRKVSPSRTTDSGSSLSTSCTSSQNDEENEDEDGDGEVLDIDWHRGDDREWVAAGAEQEEEIEEEEDEVDRSSFGNYSFNSNHVEISTCYNGSGTATTSSFNYDEEELFASGDGKGGSVHGGGGAVKVQNRSYSLSRLNKFAGLTTPAAAALFANFKHTQRQRSRLASEILDPQSDEPSLPDFPVPVCGDDDSVDDEENDGGVGGFLPSLSSSSCSSRDSSCYSATSRCSWYKQYYGGGIYEAERERRIEEKIQALQRYTVYIDAKI